MIRASWQLSAFIAAALALVTVLCRRAERPLLRRVGAFATEFTLVIGIFAVYQYCAHFAHTHVAGAFARAEEIWRLERWLHLPSEVWVMTSALPHTWLVRAADDYYAGVHLTSMTVFLVWMWWRHRELYVEARNTVAIGTLTCVLIQMVPVAPPRMLTDLGFVDVALHQGQSVYGTGGSGIANQLAAMPSIHVLWASILAYYGLRASSSRWRWLLLAHLAVTVWVVTVTANHWWLDGIVAAGILAAVLGMTQLYEQLRRQRADAPVLETIS